ncbi:hypothetical protein CLAFUW4_14199 [Fulvia fulva]|uniref:Uncharacterized protein n=1 Tax=Passalora fulva TaxID=5499 RepID=A0A9Q8PLS3_PASFU|nr:uncharacterized protein CLAFUR5_14032 [Fulvia fulva]KAK4610494.1 hypothetical protein CLAFUR4_14202 [Fulvia fulva]KAK4611212.1 hypothetical protein CLAFUR0_14207 [Fulvia fulva]UJO24727.1 hypothetical protein CLAFUR5_14032 [Fulvia fulva]WPV21795.1 hypothetical protein CLAFUW4_14199 [Fulvia fulva]WPV36967.1 hypothetical protein CLAFUW7_14210 [Fulvia fulva]
MATSNTSRGLLDLPAEIWSHVGKLAIDASPVIDNEAVEHCTVSHQQTRHSARQGLRVYQPPITKVSRALREELLPYYYQTKICIWWDMCSILNKRHLLGWLKAIGEDNRRNLGGFYFSLSIHSTTSHDWPIRRLRQTLRAGCGADVVLRGTQSTVDGHRKFRVEFLS